MSATTIKINSNLIQGTTAKAYLIKLPKVEFKFWVSKKMVKENGYLTTVFLPDHFKMELKRYSKTNFRKVLDTWSGSPIEMVERFGLSIV